jgi:hypothetical protein
MFGIDLTKYLVILCAAFTFIAAEVAVGGAMLDALDAPDFQIELAVG